MEIKYKKRRTFARRLIENQIESTLNNLGRRKAEQFTPLFNWFRTQSDLLSYRPLGGRVRFHATEEVLRVLTELFSARGYWIRDPFHWQVQPGDFTFYSQLSSLTRHLLVTHEVPRFLDSAWWSQSAESKRHRMWFRHLGQGNSMLGLRVKGLNSRPIVKRFMQAPDHYTVSEAIAWAQKPAADPAPRPVYPAGLSRRRQKRIVGRKHSALWNRIGVKDFQLTEYRFGILNIWRIRQIRRPELLREEGKVMEHCVATYEQCCQSQKTTIWSMTRKIFDGKARTRDRVLTIEVAPRRLIKQALGLRNRGAKKVEREILNRWAEQENLRIDRWV